jgi:hypothetical protein
MAREVMPDKTRNAGNNDLSHVRSTSRVARAAMQEDV